jgi:hypothetical protein
MIEPPTQPQQTETRAVVDRRVLKSFRRLHDFRVVHLHGIARALLLKEFHLLRPAAPGPDQVRPSDIAEYALDRLRRQADFMGWTQRSGASSITAAQPPQADTARSVRLRKCDSACSRGAHAM